LRCNKESWLFEGGETVKNKERPALIKYRGKRTQAEMASQYGVSQQLWSCWEKGISAPTLPIIKQLEADSGVPMEKLFFDLFDKETRLKPA
jgi:transcriptional regulator with XRE-family HTH domain